jgi:hypothetical protein
MTTKEKTYMNFAQGMAWLHFNTVYQRQFGCVVPDWVCTLEMSKKLRLVRAACVIGMPLAKAVLVRNEANDPRNQWG